MDIGGSERPATQRFAQAPVTLVLDRLDPNDTRPLYIQIAAGLRDAIRDGRLPQARPLPLGRTLATFYAVTRRTVTEAVAVLLAEGIVRNAPGAGTFVCAMPPPIPAQQPATKGRCRMGKEWDTTKDGLAKTDWEVLRKESDKQEEPDSGADKNPPSEEK
jgi:DNA-binding transcriptional regulator YhcF (GntR family)